MADTRKTVNVVKGSADEAILRQQYGDSIGYNYTNRNQFVGGDRYETNSMYRDYLGSPTTDAGDLHNYSGVDIVNGYGGAPAYAPARPGLKSAAELAALYGGITYDEDAIRAKFDAASKAEYAALRNEYDATANQFYGQMYGTQNTALDTIRKANASAVATGASRGIQAANELSAILGLEQTNAATATQLASDRNALMDKEQAAYAKNVVDALTTSNTTKQALATLGANLYASDTQFDVGEMNYYAALNQAEKALEGSKYTADSNLTGTKYAADSNLEGAKYSADSTVKAAGISAAATVKAAQEANKAQSSYYDYMQKQAAADDGKTDYQKGMDYLQNQYDKFMADKNYDAAAIWYSKLTGLDYNQALKNIKNSSIVKADLAVAAKTTKPAYEKSIIMNSLYPSLTLTP
jgi:hypothetical protein